MAARYTKEHEWVRVDGDVATVGVSVFAADQLGDVVYVELPPVGKKVTQGGDMAVVESAKPPPTFTRRCRARSSPSTTR